MSCDWDVYCVDCDEESGISDANNQEKLMKLLIEKRDALAALGDVIGEFEDSGLTEIRLGGEYVKLEFFTEHRGHRLRARNEYGEFPEPCGQEFSCKFCKAKVKCERNEGHRKEVGTPEHYHLAEQTIHWGEPS